MRDRDEIEEAYHEALRLYFDDGNVTGVDIGCPDEATPGEAGAVVRVHVRRGTDREELLAKWREDLPALEITTVEYAPASLPVKVAPPPRRSERNPIRPGISVGPKDVGQGTMGLIVRDHKNKDAILSAAHVLAHPNGNGEIFQPSPRDAKSKDAVADLGKWKLQVVDAAVARLNGKRKREPRQFESDALVTGARRAQCGDLVAKSSLNTGLRAGKVDGIGKYKYRAAGTLVAVEGFRVVPLTPGHEISAAGDSGGVWYHIKSADDWGSGESREGAGLHVAGETDSDPAAEYAVAVHLELVEQELSITLP